MSRTTLISSGETKSTVRCEGFRRVEKVVGSLFGTFLRIFVRGFDWLLIVLRAPASFQEFSHPECGAVNCRFW